jgi:uridylate kinase
MGDIPLYKRILIKLSGESLTGPNSYGIDPDTLTGLCEQIKRVYEAGVEIGLVIGGGNIFRGLKASQSGVDRVTADTMGMLATVVNSLALQDKLEQMGLDTRVLSAVRIDTYVEPYIRRRAIRHLEKGRIVILAAGTGNPFFTTDTAAALRAVEIGAEILLKGTRVDGVYSSDPERDADAELYSEVSYYDVLAKDLKVMDGTSIALCRENNIPIRVFNLGSEDNLYRAGVGEQVGTLVHGDMEVGNAG